MEPNNPTHRVTEVLLKMRCVRTLEQLLTVLRLAAPDGFPGLDVMESMTIGDTTITLRVHWSDPQPLKP